jgi:hypothetical protein
VVDHILATPGLSDTQRAAMLGGTALQPIGIGAQAAAMAAMANATGRGRASVHFRD